MDSEALSPSELQVRRNFIAIIRCTNTVGKRRPFLSSFLYTLPLIKHRGREIDYPAARWITLMLEDTDSFFNLDDETYSVENNLFSSSSSSSLNQLSHNLIRQFVNRNTNSWTIIYDIYNTYGMHGKIWDIYFNLIIKITRITTNIYKDNLFCLPLMSCTSNSLRRTCILPRSLLRNEGKSGRVPWRSHREM